MWEVDIGFQGLVGLKSWRLGGFFRRRIRIMKCTPFLRVLRLLKILEGQLFGFYGANYMPVIKDHYLFVLTQSRKARDVKLSRKTLMKTIASEQNPAPCYFPCNRISCG